jgi:hypothetical protein
MPRIIRERYENGVLIERTIEGSTFKARKWLMLFAHLSISLAVLDAVAVHDSLALGGELRAVWVQVVGPAELRSSFSAHSALANAFQALPPWVMMPIEALSSIVFSMIPARPNRSTLASNL